MPPPNLNPIHCDQRMVDQILPCEHMRNNIHKLDDGNYCPGFRRRIVCKVCGLTMPARNLF